MLEAGTLRILWLEDQMEEVQEGVERTIELFSEKLEQGVELVPATNLADAVKYLTDPTDDGIGLMILDIILPRTDSAKDTGRVDMNAGFLLWHKLRKQLPLRNRYLRLPICVVTARLRPVFRDQMVRDKWLVWLEKPVLPNEIVERVMKTLFGDGQRKDR